MPSLILPVLVLLQMCAVITVCDTTFLSLWYNLKKWSQEVITLLSKKRWEKRDYLAWLCQKILLQHSSHCLPVVLACLGGQ